MSDIERQLIEETRRWQGVSVQIERGSKHPKLVLTVNGQIRKHPYPLSPGDVRSVQNNVAQLRRTLLDLGARRLQPKEAAPPAAGPSADVILRAEAETARLKGQLAQAREEIARLSSATPTGVVRVEQLEAGLRTLHELLQSDHARDCPARWRSCSCGLDERSWDGAMHLLNGEPV